MQVEGIYTPVVTPYDENHDIDHAGFVRAIEHLIAAGVHGIVLAGTTSEYYAQSREERVELMALARETVPINVPLFVGVGAIRTEDCIAYAEAAAAAGADGILLGSPYYALPTQRELARHALAVDRAAGLPIMLYNYPGRTGVMMGAEFLDIVGRSPNFCAIKESSGDVNQLHLLARDYPHITLGCGMDDQALEFFAWGARAWICAGSNFLPAELIALYRACAIVGDFDKGRRIMSAMLPLMRVLEQSGKFVQSIKYGCELIGLPVGPVRRPLDALNKEEKRELDQIIGTLRTTVAQITNSTETNA